MEAKLPDAVDGADGLGDAQDMHAALMSRRADAVTAADAAGRSCSSRCGQSPTRRRWSCTARKVVRSSQVSNTRVKGSART